MTGDAGAVDGDPPLSSGEEARHARAAGDASVPPAAPAASRRARVRSEVDRYRIRVALLALCVFVLDSVSQADIAVPVLYAVVVLLAMRSGRRGDVVVAGWGSIALIVASFLFTLNPRLPIATSLSNSALSAIAVVCVMVLCLKNINSQTEIVRARDRMASVSRGIFMKTLSVSVVHEVTQPLTAIGANAEAAQRWLNRSPPNLDETKAATRRIAAEVERASSVIDRLRRLTAAGAVTTERCDARVLIEEATEHLRREIDETDIDVTLACPPDVTITADRILIEQVVINALSNSVDALRTVEAAPRSIVVEVRSLPGRVVIAIRDSGIGADEATLEQMFDPFFTTKVGSGMGIGLAVSSSIVDAHGGSIRAFANTPRGLVVEFMIPAIPMKRR